MLLKLNQFQIQVRRPILFVGPHSTELVFRYTNPRILLPVQIRMGYRVRPYNKSDNAEIINLLSECGLSFSRRQLDEALHLCIPQGIHLIESTLDGSVASMMMSRHMSTDEFPFGGRIDWLATSLKHRSNGLGRASIALATNHLIKSGYSSIWVTTQSSRLNAIKLFMTSGFSPTEQTLSTNNWKRAILNLST